MIEAICWECGIIVVSEKPRTKVVRECPPELAARIVASVHGVIRDSDMRERAVVVCSKCAAGPGHMSLRNQGGQDIGAATADAPDRGTDHPFPVAHAEKGTK